MQGFPPHTEAVTDKAMPNKTQPSALTETLNSPVTQPAGLTSTLLSLISLSLFLSCLWLKFIICRMLANQISLLIVAPLFEMPQFYFGENRNMVYDYVIPFNQHSNYLKLLTFTLTVFFHFCYSLNGIRGQNKMVKKKCPAKIYIFVFKDLLSHSEILMGL